MIERRGAILRHSLHTSEVQLAKEGITVDFDVLLAECIFAGNALTNVGGASPYSCRFGSTPALLPDKEILPGEGRSLDRVREVSLQRMVEATALAKVKRALDTKTTASGQQYDYQPGELVEHFTPANQHDISGWRGPAEVIESVSSRGHVRLSW